MFAYCGNNPVSFVDPTGHASISFTVNIVDPGDDYGVGGFGGVVATLWIISKIVDFFTPSPDPIPEVAIPNTDAQAIPQSQAKSIAIADEKVDEKSKRYSYWDAVRVGKQVIVGAPLTFGEALLRVATGHSIMCKDQLSAFVLVKIGGYNAVGPERHGDEGFYWHYHPSRNHTGTKESIHIWWYGGAICFGPLKLRD